MSIRTAKDLMLSIEELPVVPAGATLGEAVQVMEEVECPAGMRCSRHHWALIRDDDGAIVGWIGMSDVLTSLDPRYHTRKGLEEIRAPGVNPDMLRKLVEGFGADRSPLAHVCDKAARVRARDLMHRPGDGERIDAGAPIDEIVTRLVNDGHPMLLVTEDGREKGVIRLEDAFEAVSEAIRRCSA